MTERCTTCHQAIGEREPACLYNGNIVCQDCDTRLRGRQTVGPVGLVKVKAPLNTLLIIVSVLGLLVSAALFLGPFVGFFSPPPKASRWLMLGCLLIAGYWSTVSNKTRKEMGKKAFNQSLIEHTPKWTRCVLGILMLLCLITFGYAVIVKNITVSPISMEPVARSAYFSGCMALYTLNLSLFYSFRQFEPGGNAQGYPQTSDADPTS